MGGGGGGALDHTNRSVSPPLVVSCKSLVKLTSGTIEKLRPVKQCFSAGNRIPYFSEISGNGVLFFCSANSNKSYNAQCQDGQTDSRQKNNDLPLWEVDS